MFKIAPSVFAQLYAPSASNCGSCGTSERTSFQFDYAYQPIVDLAGGSIYAHEALVRGPAGCSGRAWTGAARALPSQRTQSASALADSQRLA
jgi:hypothetical protein